MFSMENSFSSWLYDRLNEKGWSQSELARRSGIAPGTLSNILSGKRGLGKDTLTAIADAFRLPAKTVYEAAGFFPPEGNQTTEMDAVLESMKDLPAEWQAKIAEDARRTREFYEAQERERASRELRTKKGTGPLTGGA